MIKRSLIFPLIFLISISQLCAQSFAEYMIRKDSLDGFMPQLYENNSFYLEAGLCENYDSSVLNDFALEYFFLSALKDRVTSKVNYKLDNEVAKSNSVANKNFKKYKKDFERLQSNCSKEEVVKSYVSHADRQILLGKRLPLGDFLSKYTLDSLLLTQALQEYDTLIPEGKYYYNHDYKMGLFIHPLALINRYIKGNIEIAVSENSSLELGLGYQFVNVFEGKKSYLDTRGQFNSNENVSLNRRLQRDWLYFIGYNIYYGKNRFMHFQLFYKDQGYNEKVDVNDKDHALIPGTGFLTTGGVNSCSLVSYDGYVLGLKFMIGGKNLLFNSGILADRMAFGFGLRYKQGKFTEHNSRLGIENCDLFPLASEPIEYNIEALVPSIHFNYSFGLKLKK